MRIGFDAKRVFCNQRGLGNYGRNLLDSLVKYYPYLSFHLFTPSHGEGELAVWESIFSQKAEGEIILPGGAWRMARSVWRSSQLAGLAKKKKLDIFHGLSHELPVKIEKSGVKSVVTIHDLLYLRLPEFYPLIDRKVYHQKVKHSCQKADRIVAIGQQTKDDLIDKLEVDPDRIEVIYQSCNPIYYQLLNQGELETVRQRYHLPEKFLLYVGAITPAKNIAAIVGAIDQISPEERVPLVIVGQNSSYMPKLLELINSKRLNDQVVFLSPPQHDLPAIYQLATIFVFPTLFEGFGIPIIEALFSGTPVITTNEAVFSEAGGENSIYVDPQNHLELAASISLLLKDDQKREEMSKRGVVYAHHRFHQEVTTVQMFNLYRDLLEGSN